MITGDLDMALADAIRAARTTGYLPAAAAPSPRDGTPCTGPPTTGTLSAGIPSTGTPSTAGTWRPTPAGAGLGDADGERGQSVGGDGYREVAAAGDCHIADLGPCAEAGRQRAG
ncbi:MAG TPA: hypothetical protein VII22_16255, partial [Streptosporangiaceae bacterium]